VIGKFPAREKSLVEFQALFHSHWKQEEIPGGDAPGKRPEEPNPQLVRKKKRHFVR